MPWTDWKFPSAEATRGTGLATWSNESNIEADDGSIASTNVKSTASLYMVASDCGLTATDVPANTVIVAVQVETEIKAWDDAGTGGVHTYYVGLHNDPTTVPSDTGRQTATYTVNSTTVGGATFQVDTFTGLFGQSLTQAIVTGADFGPWLQAAGGTRVSGDELFGVDYIKLRVLWDYPGGGMIGDI